MTEYEVKRIDNALDCLADAADTLTGEDRTRLVAIMQELSEMTGHHRHIETWLADCAAGGVTVH